jgi:muramidase (phage lysozyme)
MATLPDVTSLSRPSGSSAGRGSAGYGAPAFARPIAPVDPVKISGVEAPVVDTGAGLRAVGQGIEKAASAAAYAYGHEQVVQRRLNEAGADATYITQASKIKLAIDQSNDINQINSLKEQLSQLPEQASANLPEDQREYFKIKQSKYVADGLAHADGRIYNITRDGDIAATNDTLKNLAEAYATGDKQTRAYSHETAGLLYEQLAAKGYYGAEQIRKFQDEWSVNAVKAQKELLPPSERISALGGVLPGKIVAGDLPPQAVGLLNAIGAPESNGKYNVRFTANGGTTFDDLSNHPNIPERILSGPNAGKTSTAAGRYQFIKSTWDSIPAEFKGDGSFKEENQDRAAWFLAQRDYKARTGSDLNADLQKNGLTPEIVAALGDTWEGLKVNPKKALAAYNATMSGKVDVTAAMDSGDADASVLPVDTRLLMLRQAIAEDTKINNQQIQNQKFLEKDIRADIDMVAVSGIPMDGLRDRVQATFGPDAVKQLDTDREQAGLYFTATSNMKTATNAELDSLTLPLAPTPGSPSYAQQAKYYDDALKQIGLIRKARAEDPAGYVDDSFDQVKAAKSAVDPNNLSSFRGVVNARIAAQDALGIPRGFQAVMSSEEAKHYATLLRPFSRGQAELGGQEEQANQIAQEIQQKYGEHARDAWRRINMQATLKSNLASIVADAVSAAAEGQPVNVNTPQNAERAQFDRDQSRAAAIAGETAPIQAPQQTAATPPGGQYATPVDKLRAHPELIEIFVGKYGVKAVPEDMRDLLTVDQQALINNNPLGSK